jgi:hypothetical protein
MHKASPTKLKGQMTLSQYKISGGCEKKIAGDPGRAFLECKNLVFAIFRQKPKTATINCCTPKTKDRNNGSTIRQAQGADSSTSLTVPEQGRREQSRSTSSP